MRGLGRGLRAALPGIVAALVTTALALGGWYGYVFATTSERFAVGTIEVRGNATLSREHIESLLEIGPGDNIFGADLDRMSEVLEAEPVIAEATVSRRLPDTLVVDIEEHRPAAVVQLGGPYLSDASGHVYKRAAIADGDGAGLPVITGLQREAYIGEPQAVATEIVRALTAVAVYDEVDTRPALSDLHLHPRQGLTFITYERAMQIRVGHGRDDTLRANLRAFDTAWNALSAEEKARTRVVHADTTNRRDRVTVGFEHLER